MKRFLFPIIFFLNFTLTCFLYSCQGNYAPGTFGNDIRQLSNIEDLKILSRGKSMIAVSPSMQGRVLTSSATGMDGTSLGWFNPNSLSTPENFGNLGGESRMWLGPEAGKYGLFFRPGDIQNHETVHLPEALDTLKFNTIEQTATSLTCENDMEITNASGTSFHIMATRKIKILPFQELENLFNLPPARDLDIVAFSAETRIQNTGSRQWKKETGLLSIWDIGCMLPSPKTVVIIPISSPVDSITNYFTALESNRIKISDKAVFYKADAAYMNKIGVQPENCKPLFGSYNPELNLLTIVHFSLNKKGVYVNSLWDHKDPYNGDAINIFNGEVNPETDRNWPFFELESSSHTRELKPGETLSHKQIITHITAGEKTINKITQNILGVSLEEITTAFKPD